MTRPERDWDPQDQQSADPRTELEYEAGRQRYRRVRRPGRSEVFPQLPERPWNDLPIAGYGWGG